MSLPVVLVTLPILVIATFVAMRRRHARKTRAGLEQNQLDLDAVIMANVELQHVAEARDAAQRIARIATELLVAEGAIVWLQGPGGLLCAGGHGLTRTPDLELSQQSNVDQVLVTGIVSERKDEIILPLIASGGVFGAVAVHKPTRPAESFVTSVLQVFGAQAGYALERLRAVESLIDARFVDLVTGVGNRMAATVALATVHPGDAVLLLAVEELELLRATDGDERADLVLGQLGLHLRTGTRAGDLVARYDDDVFFVLLRELNATAEEVVDRLLASWQTTCTVGSLRVGAALHDGDATPIETLNRAADALVAARASSGELTRTAA